MQGALVAPVYEPTLSRLSRTSNPSTTLPKTTCFPLSQSHGIKHMKNWEPFVFGPAFAIERSPLAVCLS